MVQTWATTIGEAVVKRCLTCGKESAVMLYGRFCGSACAASWAGIAVDDVDKTYRKIDGLSGRTETFRAEAARLLRALLTSPTVK